MNGGRTSVYPCSRSFEAGAQVPIDGETGARDFGGAFEVKNAKRLTQVPVRLGSEIESRRRAPAADFDIVLGAVANRNAGIRKVRDAGEDVAKSCVGFFGDFLRVGNFVF